MSNVFFKSLLLLAVFSGTVVSMEAMSEVDESAFIARRDKVAKQKAIKNRVKDANPSLFSRARPNDLEVSGTEYDSEFDEDAYLSVLSSSPHLNNESDPLPLFDEPSISGKFVVDDVIDRAVIESFVSTSLSPSDVDIFNAAFNSDPKGALKSLFLAVSEKMGEMTINASKFDAKLVDMEAQLVGLNNRLIEKTSANRRLIKDITDLDADQKKSQELVRSKVAEFNNVINDLKSKNKRLEAEKASLLSKPKGPTIVFGKTSTVNAPNKSSATAIDSTWTKADTTMNDGLSANAHFAPQNQKVKLNDTGKYTYAATGAVADIKELKERAGTSNIPTKKTLIKGPDGHTFAIGDIDLSK